MKGSAEIDTFALGTTWQEIAHFIVRPFSLLWHDETVCEMKRSILSYPSVICTRRFRRKITKATEGSMTSFLSENDGQFPINRRQISRDQQLFLIEITKQPRILANLSSFHTLSSSSALPRSEAIPILLGVLISSPIIVMMLSSFVEKALLRESIRNSPQLWIRCRCMRYFIPNSTIETLHSLDFTCSLATSRFAVHGRDEMEGIRRKEWTIRLERHVKVTLIDDVWHLKMAISARRVQRGKVMRDSNTS